MERKNEDNNEANAMLAGGAAIAAIGVAGAVAGAVCPVCVVAAPLLLGVGVVRKIRAARRRAVEDDVPGSTDAGDASILPDTRSP